MMTAPLLSPLLLALAAGMAAPAHATADNPTSFPPQACQSVRAELDAVATHLREARASFPPGVLEQKIERMVLRIHEVSKDVDRITLVNG